MFAKVKAVALRAITAAAVAARSAALALLSVPGSTKGTILAGEFKRALAIAATAATFAGGLEGFVSYLASDQTFIAAVVPLVQVAAARVGLALPGAIVTPVVTFALAQIVALLAYLHSGRNPAAVGHFLVEAGSPDFGFPLIEVKAPGQDLASLGGRIAAKYGTSVRIMRDGEDPHEPFCIDVQVPAQADEHALFDAIRADFPGTAATLYV